MCGTGGGAFGSSDPDGTQVGLGFQLPVAIRGGAHKTPAAKAELFKDRTARLKSCPSRALPPRRDEVKFTANLKSCPSQPRPFPSLGACAPGQASRLSLRGRWWDRCFGRGRLLRAKWQVPVIRTIKRTPHYPVRMGGVRYNFVHNSRRLLWNWNVLIGGRLPRRLFGGGGFGLPEIWIGFDPLVLNVTDSGIEYEQVGLAGLDGGGQVCGLLTALGAHGFLDLFAGDE